MRIPCPFCGSRDSGEFVYRGEAAPVRPALADGASAADPARDGTPGEDGADAAAAMFAYLYPRDNPAGPHAGHWYHAQGCRSWLVVTRDTLTHAIAAVRLAAPEPAPEPAPGAGGDAA